MDFRTSRQPPGTYANKVAAVAAAARLSKSRSNSAKNKDTAEGKKPSVEEEEVVVQPGLQDGECV